MMTTNTELTFEQAYKIYSTRWSVEVFFKECKQNLGLENVKHKISMLKLQLQRFVWCNIIYFRL